MPPSLDRTFGILIAFILPGFVALAGASQFSPTIAGWLLVKPSLDSSMSGFLFVTLSSLTAGMIASAFRWLIIDGIHHHYSLPTPKLDFSRLQANLDAFQLAVEHNYRHYQFYANMIPATLFYSVVDQVEHGLWPLFPSTLLLILELVFWATSRDCLRRYYERIAQFLPSETVTPVTASISPPVSQTPQQIPPA